jgi:hypothetical protein
MGDVVSGSLQDDGMGDDDEDAGQLDDAGRTVRPCIQCRVLVTFDGQPGDAVCDACGVRQYLTAPSALYPTGGMGRYA